MEFEDRIDYQKLKEYLRPTKDEKQARLQARILQALRLVRIVFLFPKLLIYIF